MHFCPLPLATQGQPNREDDGLEQSYWLITSTKAFILPNYLSRERAQAHFPESAAGNQTKGVWCELARSLTRPHSHWPGCRCRRQLLRPWSGLQASLFFALTDSRLPFGEVGGPSMRAQSWNFSFSSFFRKALGPSTFETPDVFSLLHSMLACVWNSGRTRGGITC